MEAALEIARKRQASDSYEAGIIRRHTIIKILSSISEYGHWYRENFISHRNTTEAEDENLVRVLKIKLMAIQNYDLHGRKLTTLNLNSKVSVYSRLLRKTV